MIRKTWQFKSDRITSNTDKLKTTTGCNCRALLDILKLSIWGRSAMHKLLYFATIGLLAFSIGGCGGEGSNTASPSPSPSAPSPSPAASASPTPAAQTFQSPIVAAQPPGLIRSTNPDERARQTQTAIGDNKNRNPTQSLPPVPIGPLTANPSQADPFGPLPPIVLQIPSGANAGAGMTSALPKLPQREVADLPKLPVVAPPQIGTPIPGTDLTFFPGGTGSQIGSPPQVPGLNTPQIGRGGRNGSLPGGTGVQLGSPPQIPGLNAPQLGRIRTSPPGLEPIAARPIGVPDLPELPVENRPPQWRDPNARVRRGTATRPPGTTPIAARPQAAPNRPTRRPAPPRPPQPIAARPIGVPDLPELPVDKRPPQWRDPNPPPPPVIPVVPPPPPPPSTELATGTEVSGVVKVGNQTQVIVKVPNEPTSRYVKIGQRLSNGQVLVKRVDLKEGADPIVILEQNGVEVAKAVGEKPPSPQQPANGVISRLPNPNSSTRR